MKNKITFVLISVCFFGLCQRDTNLISRHRPGIFWYFNGLRPLKDADNRKYDRLVFDFTYNDWSGAVKPFQNKWNSLGLNTNFISDLRFKNNKIFSLGVGLGYGYSTIATELKIIETSHNSVALSYKQASETYDYASIHFHRFYFPLEFRFSSEKWNRAKFILGGTIGIQTGLKQVLITRESFDKQKETNNLANYSLFNYGLHFRFGLRNIAFFGAYQLNPIFKKGENPELYQLQFGLSLSLF
jgi:hypothetical protein